MVWIKEDLVAKLGHRSIDSVAVGAAKNFIRLLSFGILLRLTVVLRKLGNFVLDHWTVLEWSFDVPRFHNDAFGKVLRIAFRCRSRWLKTKFSWDSCRELEVEIERLVHVANKERRSVHDFVLLCEFDHFLIGKVSIFLADVRDVENAEQLLWRVVNGDLRWLSVYLLITRVDASEQFTVDDDSVAVFEFVSIHCQCVKFLEVSFEHFVMAHEAFILLQVSISSSNFM